MLPTKYRSLFTGTEIDQILQSVRDKIDKSAITQDFSSGEADQVVSAAAVKALSEAFDNTFTPTGVKELLAQAPDSNIFTDDDKRKVDAINVQFKGTVVDIPSRDAIDTAQYTGGEVILVLRTAARTTEFQWWDGLTDSWEPVNAGVGDIETVVLPTGTTVIAGYDSTLISGVKYVIHGKSATGDSHMAEVMIVSKGVEISFSVFAEVVAGVDAFYLSVTKTGDEVELNVTTTTALTSITILKQAEF